MRERVDYSAFGFAQHRPFADIDGDGIGSDDAIVSAIVNQCNGGTAVPIGHSCYTAEADINRDGVIDYVSSSSDYALAAAARTSTLAPGEISAVHNIFGWNGAVFDSEGSSNGLYLMRMRHYSPVRQRWLQRDPAGYMDSANLYGYVAGNPIGWSDPYGLQQVGQAGEFVGSDPVQFGGGSGMGRFGDIADAGLGRITAQDRLDPWLDEFIAGLEPSGLRLHRYSREEWAAEKFWLPLHGYLDLIGNVPVVGDAADALNALLYIGKGDWMNAAISGAAIVVPGLAMGARRGVRLVFNSEAEAAHALARIKGGESVDDVLGAGRAAGSTEQIDHLAGSIPNTNPRGAKNNCVNCAIATDATLSGHRASALPYNPRTGIDEPIKVDVLFEMYGRARTARSRDDIILALKQAGHGARVVVFGKRGNVPGHIWNGYYADGIIHFIDGQTGQVATWDGYTEYMFWIVRGTE